MTDIMSHSQFHRINRLYLRHACCNSRPCAHYGTYRLVAGNWVLRVQTNAIARKKMDGRSDQAVLKSFSLENLTLCPKGFHDTTVDFKDLQSPPENFSMGLIGLTVECGSALSLGS